MTGLSEKLRSGSMLKGQTVGGYNSNVGGRVEKDGVVCLKKASVE